MPTYDVRVNGKAEQVTAAADMPLLWVLRDLLGLTGTKYGCGAGQCRSCTVHLDGEPVFSCVVPIASAAGRSVTTIEGLSGAELHPVQQAWIEEDVVQCGFCQPGQIMTAAALLASNPSPTDSEIDDAMSPVLCRCGTYNRIRQAIRRAAKEMST
jgi:aerobic-type carbon monoxide dehydrogenase small subunit (CoxS/CutS family)